MRHNSIVCESDPKFKWEFGIPECCTALKTNYKGVCFVRWEVNPVLGVWCSWPNMLCYICAVIAFVFSKNI